MGVSGLGMVLGMVAGCATGDGRREPAPRLVARWDFNQPANPELWQPGQGVEITNVRDGVMELQISHFDAFIFAPQVETPLDGCAVRIRCRADRDGDVQVYWKTADDPVYSERQVVHKQVRRSKDFQTVELIIGRPRDAGRMLTGFRIDPYNGPRRNRVEIDWVELVRLPAEFDASWTASAAQVEPGQPVELRLRFRQTSGVAVRSTIRVTGPDGQVQQIRPSEPGAEGRVVFRVSPQSAGVHRYRVVAGPADGARLFDLQTSLVAGLAGEPVGKVTIGGGELRLELLEDAEGKTFGAGRLWLRLRDKQWRLAGLLEPLAEIVCVSQAGSVVGLHPRFGILDRDELSVRLIARVPYPPGRPPTSQQMVRLTLRMDPNRSSLAVDARLDMPQGTRVSKFAAPTLLVPGGKDPLDRYGLFGGLEMLAPGWRSSSDRAVGERFAKRWTPHPYKITLPIMAIEQNGVTTSLLWYPLQKWDGRHDMPAATFASPNFLYDQPSHLCQLFAPGLPEWFEENTTRAPRPYVMSAGRPLRLQYRIRAAANEPIVEAARSWYRIFKLPKPPPAPHDVKTTYDLCAQCYGQTVYWQDALIRVAGRERKGGWRGHWFLDRRSRFIPHMVAELLTHATLTGQRKWLQRTHVEDEGFVIGALGSLADRLKPPGHVKQALASQRPDGTWAFTHTQRMIEMTKKLTQGRRETLGQEGATSLGTCVQPALGILRHALLTGDPKYVKAGVQALEAMKRFRIPRGAQVWEVPLETPDIRAAALAVEAYRIGYQLTGKREYLNYARYWAASGLPFVYSWRVPHDREPLFVMTSKDRVNRSEFGAIPAKELFADPHRRITPYATVPVMGTSYYVVNWFGVVVQWCGLEWACKVLELTDIQPDPLLRRVAKGVLLSGRQQMFDKEPMVGLYPDIWPLITNRPGGALICCDWIVRGLRAERAIPSWPTTWTRVVRAGRKRVHVSGWGDPKRCTRTGKVLRVEVDFAPHKPNELLVVRDVRPKAVRVAGRDLPEGDGANAWRYRPGAKALLVRFEQPERVTTIEIAY